MDDFDLRGRIEKLEADAERAAETIEECRKAILLSKAAMAAGALGVVCSLFGLLHLPAALVVTSIGAMIGGVVWYGSNHSTRDEAQERLRAIERERASAIDALHLREGAVTLH